MIHKKARRARLQLRGHAFGATKHLEAGFSFLTYKKAARAAGNSVDMHPSPSIRLEAGFNFLVCKKGFTLLEVTIALALWLILSAGVIFLWQYSTRMGQNLIARQNNFENARVAMDGLLMNIQMAQEILLITDSRLDEENVLRHITLTGLTPGGALHGYQFHFDAAAVKCVGAMYRRLSFARQVGTAVPTNEFATNITMVRITYIEGSRLDIFIETGCPLYRICNCTGTGSCPQRCTASCPRNNPHICTPGCPPNIVLEGSVDTRFKNARVNP